MKLRCGLFLLILMPLSINAAYPIGGLDPISKKPEKTSFYFGKEIKRFLNFPDLRLTLSENCGTNVRKMSCMAALSLKNASLLSIPPGKLASRNPGSVVCSEVLHERVIVGTDPHRNENSFCLFKDGSLVDTGTLTYYSKMNDSRKTR